MAKQGSTKDKILKLISEGDNNLSAISQRLDLAPSTVSKHLQDLEVSGAIVQKDNPYVKKWKYYKLNSENAPRKSKDEGFATSGNLFKAGAFVVILALVVGASFLYLQNNSSKSVYIPVSLTDPPEVPAGTQALYINYSSLSVRLNYGGSSEWVSVNATGSLNLMSLINVSQVLGNVKITPNSTVDMVRFNITSSSITIDNATYPVQVMTKQVVAKAENNIINKSSSILLDFSPVVVPAYSQNSTSFALFPSLRAAVVSNPGLHANSPLPTQNSGHARYSVQQYKDLFRGGNASLAIESATLHSSGNYTTFNLDLLNNGTGNITVMAVMIYGNETPSEMPEAVIVNGTAIVNASDIRNEQWQGNAPANPGMMGSGGRMGPRPFDRNDSDVSINESAVREAGAFLGVNAVLIRMPGHSGNILIRDIGAPYARMFVINKSMDITRWPGIDFLVGGNGTLFMPSPQSMMTPTQRPGYLLMPKSSVTLSYNGTLRMMGGGLLLTLPSGGNYQIMVVTNEGIAQANITSS